MNIATGEDKRLPSLDLFRGITIAAMILVNNQGNWNAVYPAFRHAAWHGWLGADFVFPFFLFAVGSSIHVSFSSRLRAGTGRGALFKKAARRTVILIVLGLILNLFPFFNFETLRIPGVLQRIGLCYFFASIIYLYGGKQLLIWITAALLLFYGALILWVTPQGFGHGSLDPCCNLPGFVDGALFPGHTYEHAPVPGFDPEGLLTTIPAIASAMMGIFAAAAAERSMAGTLRRWIIPCAGGLMVAAGMILDLFIPINKNLWTPSYVLFMGGLALIIFFICHYLCDVRRSRAAAAPFLILGRNALAAYLLSSLAGKAMISFYVKCQEAPITIKSCIFTHVFAPWFEPATASILYAAAYLMLWWGFMYILYRKKIIVKL
ncbi:MAG: DUF5009 domain-containing protein [Spirochaetes bacterium]|nr:DUF5009 domain-containing protein [Spirochaetota bacterium]